MIPPAPWRVVIVTVVPEVAVSYSEAVRALGHEAVAVLAARPRPGAPAEGAARLIHESAGAGLDVVFPTSRRALAPLLAALRADLGLCTGYPWRIPGDAIATPQLGIVNGHPSLLPRYRGPFPVAWAVRNGETEIGMTYHRMDESFDTGAILAQRAIPLGDAATFDELVPSFPPVTRELLPVVFDRLARGDLGEPQEGGEYQSGFEPEYLRVDVASAAADVHRQTRAWAFMPPIRERGPLLERGGSTIRLIKTSLTEVDGAERLECADGPLWIVESEPAPLTPSL